MVVQSVVQALGSHRTICTVSIYNPIDTLRAWIIQKKQVDRGTIQTAIRVVHPIPLNIVHATRQNYFIHLLAPSSPVAKLETMFSTTMFKDIAERALSTFCQTLVALIGTDGAGLLDVGLVDSLSASLVAALLSVLKSYAAIKSPRGDASASLVDLTDA
jgi:hypothetical protein